MPPKFSHLGDAAGVEAEHFERRWVMDEAYELHEISAIDFAEYVRRRTSPSICL